jgi:ZIP family zinc transporter
VTDLVLIIIYSLLSGSTIFLGGILSYYFGDHVKNGLVKAEIIHASIAFGGGILFASVGLVLVPKGMQSLSLLPVLVCFSVGTITFYFIDRHIQTKGGSIAQLLGMLLDFIPESIAMGAVFSQNPNLGLLLAIIIGIQNLPESFNAFMDLKNSFLAWKCLLILFLLSFLGVISALAGYYLFANMPMTVGGLMLFAGGGVIYLIFQDIAPMSKLKKNWIPALGASLGFLVGMVGVKVLG